MDNRTKSQSRKQKYKAAGKGSQCGRDPVPGGKTCQRCRDLFRSYRLARQARGLCSCGRERDDPELKACEYCRAATREYNRKLRDEVFEAYGGKICACCGEDRSEFLQLDHINNDGAAHRREIQRTGLSVFCWIRANGFLPGFQVLCANCNYAKAHYGYCPHQPDKEVNDAPINAKRTATRAQRKLEERCGP